VQDADLLIPRIAADVATDDEDGATSRIARPKAGLFAGGNAPPPRFPAMASAIDRYRESHPWKDPNIRNLNRLEISLFLL
jgi:hypothetical protein